MMAQAVNHRGVLEAEADHTTTRNDEAVTDNTFISADRSRLSELQAELSPVNPAMVLGPTTGSVRHGIAERDQAGRTSVSPARSAKRAASCDSAERVRKSPERRTTYLPLQPMKPSEFRYQLSATDSKPAETNTVSPEDPIEAVNKKVNKAAADNFELVQRVNDLDQRLGSLEKTVISNGASVLEKVNELDDFRIELSERMTELCLLLKGSATHKTADKDQPPTYQISTPTPSRLPPGIDPKATGNTNPFAIGGHAAAPRNAGIQVCGIVGVDDKPRVVTEPVFKTNPTLNPTPPRHDVTPPRLDADMPHQTTQLTRGPKGSVHCVSYVNAFPSLGLSHNFVDNSRNMQNLGHTNRDAEKHPGQFHESPAREFGISMPGPRRHDINANGYYPPLEPRAPMSSQYGAGKSLYKEISYVINRKSTEDLKIFGGRIADFENWATKMSEHLAMSCNRYKNLLEQVRHSPYAFTKDGLINSQVDGFNCWEVALELGGFTMKYLSSDIYEDKYALCGGKEFNGFELWRNLECRYGGSGKEVEVSGLNKFMNFAQCKSEAGLYRHLASWEEYLTKYGSELRQTPATLRIMLLNILPKDMADKYRPKRQKYPTFQSILQHVREKLDEQRELYKAEAIHARRTDRVHAVVEPEPPVSIEASYQHVVSAVPTQPKASPGTLANPITTVDQLNEMVLALQKNGNVRKPNPRDKKGSEAKKANPFKKFIFRGCWECGDPKHSRYECPKWKALLDPQGKPPAGHKGMKDRAWAKWKEDKAASKKRDRINLLQTETDTEDEDSSDQEGDLVFSLVESGTSWTKAQQNRPSDIKPKETNRFGAFDEIQLEEDDDEPDEMVKFMNNFAHRVQLGKKQAQKLRKPKEDIDAVLKEFKNNSAQKDKTVVVQQARDLDAPEVRRIVKPLPDDPREIDRLAKLCPRDVAELEEGEIWVLWDTGASCSAMKVNRDCPQYSHLVTSTKASSSGQGAESACGGSIKERGEVSIDLLIGGEYHRMPVRDMDVSMPIASGRSCVESGDNYALLHRHGGIIKNVVSGKEIKLYGRQGVFFFKARVLPPGSIDDSVQLPFMTSLNGRSPSSPFVRLG